MIRVTFHFTFGGQGWSETLFRTVPFDTNDNIYLQDYINKRLELMATRATLKSVRMSNTDTMRDVKIFVLPSGGRSGSWAYSEPGASPGQLTETYPEDTFTALLLRLSDSANNYRSFRLLGLPDHIFGGNQIFPEEQALVNKRLNNWILAMAGAGLGSKFQTGVSASGRISLYAAKEPGNQLVQLGVKGTIPLVGSLVTLGSMGKFPKLNRTWRIAFVSPGDVSADAYIYLKGTEDLNVFGDVPEGKYKVSNYNVKLMTDYTISRLTYRKTGVPFGTVRGRR